MAADEDGSGDQVRRANRLRPEAQVRDRHRARLLRVVDEVALRVLVAVSSAMILIEFLLAPTVPSAPRPKKTARTVSAGSTSNVSSTASDSLVTSSTMPTVKWCFGAGFLHLVEDGLHHGRREFLGSEAVASADHPDVGDGRCLRAARSRRPGREARRSRPAPWCDRAPRLSRTVGGSAATKWSTLNGR